MVIIHAVQKLLNTSGIKAPLYVSQADENQQLHSWYARLVSGGSAGKLFVLYSHEPSLLTVVCRGKTIKGTWEEFTTRVPALMRRHDFPAAFVEQEIKGLDGYVVSKTDSRSMLGLMNQFVEQVEYDCKRFSSYAAIDQDFLEDNIIDYLYTIPGEKNKYTTALRYWRERFS